MGINVGYLKKVFTEQWFALLEEYLHTEDFSNLLFELAAQYSAKKVWPAAEDVFNVFKLTPLDKIKVVIIGQDPYHTPNVAHGLAFSSLQKKTPPSLRNIFKEIWEESDKTVKFEQCFPTNNLTSWAQQGVLLLNTLMSVEQKMPLSHTYMGWEKFTSYVLARVLETRKVVVTMAWGKYAQNFVKQTYKSYIDGKIVAGGYRLDQDPDIHKLFLFGDHPAAASYNSRRWFGNNHFTITNMFLNNLGISEINWETKILKTDE